MVYQTGFVPRVDAVVACLLSIIIDGAVQGLVGVANVMTDVRCGLICLCPIPPTCLRNERVQCLHCRPWQRAVRADQIPPVLLYQHVQVARQLSGRRVGFEIQVVLRPL